MHTWIDERGADRKLTVINDDAIYIDDSDTTDFTAAVAAIDEGAEPATVLSEKADRIPLMQITRVEYNADDIELDIHYKDGDDKESETYFYSSGAVRNEIADALHAALGPDFSRHVDQYSVLRAVYAPLLTLVLTTLLTWILVGAATAMEAGREVDTIGRNSLVKKIVAGLLDLLGPTGVMIVAWLVAGFALYRFYQRGSQPPLMHYIQSTPYKQPTLLGTGLKYALLLGLVFITARAIMS